MKKTTLKIHFANETAAMHFAIWLCESGEQDYWQWMECREEEEEGPITATGFLYHKDNEFVPDFEIETECGRFTEDE